MSSRWVVREHCLAASDGLQIDPICAPHLIGAAGPAAAHIGGYRVFQIRALTTFRDRVALMSSGHLH
jgi:hypothetical protein